MPVPASGSGAAAFMEPPGPAKLAELKRRGPDTDGILHGVGTEDAEAERVRRDAQRRDPETTTTVMPAAVVECPPNFGMVATGIYRCSFPRSEHFDFLKGLKLKTVLLLLSDPYPKENEQFIEENGIQLVRIGLSGNKEPFVNVDPADIARALETILNPANRPILIHCNQGKHRTGCVVGCLRRAQGWSLSLIFDEYRRFAYPKARALDQLLMEIFEPDPALDTSGLWS